MLAWYMPFPYVRLPVYHKLVFCDKKLGYRRGTARRAMVENLCCVSRGMGVIERLQTAKVEFKVIRGHWRWCYSVGHMRFSISDLLQLCLYLAPLSRVYRGTTQLNATSS